jgi:hypothetical protein
MADTMGRVERASEEIFATAKTLKFRGSLTTEDTSNIWWLRWRLWWLYRKV